MSTGAYTLNIVQPNRAGIGRSIGAAASRLRASANMAGKKSNIDRIGISYMLQEEADADVQDLNTKTPDEEIITRTAAASK